VNGPPEYLGKAGSVLARERLSQYARYAELVARQEAALDEEDLVRFEDLAHEIAELQSAIGTASPGAAFRAAAGGLESDEATQAIVVLEKTIARSEQIRQRLTSMRQASAGEIRTVMRRRPQARRYVTESARAAPPRATLDVTL